jgi:hypothetical protein
VKIEKLREILKNRLSTLDNLIVQAELSGDVSQYSVLLLEKEETEMTLSSLSSLEG